MKKIYEKPFVRDLGEGMHTSIGQYLCTAGSTDTGICSDGQYAGGGCNNGNWNRAGQGCTNGSHNAGDPGGACHNGNNNSTGGCGNGSNVTAG